MKKTILLIILAFGIIAGYANNLVISNVTKNIGDTITFDVSWDNSWRSSNGSRDGVYIFIKYKSGTQWHHLSLLNASTTGGTLDIEPTYNNQAYIFSQGALVSGATTSATITITYDLTSVGSFPDFKVFGFEMVYINDGSYYLGDGSSSDRFARGDDNALPYQVTNFNNITVGNTANDLKSLFSVGNLTQNIPSTYPTAFISFWMMKYEITQEQYVEFLNTLTVQQQQTRTESDLSNISNSNRFVMINSSTPDYRNGIACNANATNTLPITFYCDLNNNGIPNENTDGQNLPSDMSVNDILAYLDWAGLRPMTDMEFEKACRGPELPIAGEFANGTALSVNPANLLNAGAPNESVSNIGTDGLLNFGNNFVNGIIRVGAFATATSTRLQSGAGYYGVLDLSGNLNELTVVTMDANLSFEKNMRGDGILDINGNQNRWSFPSYGLLKSGGASVSLSKSISDRSDYIQNFQFDARTFNITGRGVF